LDNKGDMDDVKNEGRRRSFGFTFRAAFVFYNVAIHALFLLLWAPALLFPDFRNRFASRLGLGLPRLDRCIIVHAASAGETLAARQFIALLKERFPNVPVVVTTVTTTGRTAAGKVGADYSIGLPYDLLPSVRLAFDRLKPIGLIIVEGDFWPNVLFAAVRRGVPVAVVNGRMTGKAAAWYGAAGWLLKSLFAKIKAYAVSEQEHVPRYLSLGIEKERIEVTGNIKYDNLDGEPESEIISAVRRLLGITDRFDLIIAGSTHDGEEGIIAEAYLAARDVRPTLKLLVAPRYPGRATGVVKTLSKTGIAAFVYSDGRAGGDALVLDTMGDLGRVYAAGAVAIVGGSLVRRGGQSIVEPAYAGCAVLYGPNMYHFPYETRILEGRGGTTVGDGQELIETLTRLYREPELLETEMAKARTAAAGLMGGSARALEFVLERWGMN
jgi:3-deoxy-D-manno-octulosonic-acid transferase